MRGLDQRTIRYKRAIVRYMCLLQVMVYRSVSTSCKKKYPTLKSIADAGQLFFCCSFPNASISACLHPHFEGGYRQNFVNSKK